MPSALRSPGRPTRDDAATAATLVAFKVTASERAQLTAAAETSGLTLSSYLRSRLFTSPVMAPRRRHSLDSEQLRRTYAQLSRIGSNIHQLLKRVNFGETPPLAEYREALSGHREAMDTLRIALGRPPRHGP